VYYVYILYAAGSDLYYVGSSNNPWRRIIEHNSSHLSTFTSKHRPWILAATFQAGQTRSEAEKFEKFIKKQKSRALIEKLVDPKFKPSGILAQLVRVPHMRD